MSVQIYADFPGGNIVVDQIQEKSVFLHQDLRDTEGNWFYWYFGVRNAGGKTIRFVFTASRALAGRGPAVSLDEGRNWAWIGTKQVDGNSFTYHFPEGCDSARFSYAMPYQLADWQRFTHQRQWLNVDTLTRTKKNRDLPIATLGTGPAHIFLTARHHCCEMMPNYALEGLIDSAHSSADAGELLSKATLHIIPFVDLDGVEAGDQGKNRRPRDHGRDYKDQSIYPETAGIRQILSHYPPNVLIDLHCPWIAGTNNENIYLVGTADSRNADQQRKFCDIFRRVQRGTLRMSDPCLLPFGQAWNVPASYTQGVSLPVHALTYDTIQLATSVELPYAIVEDAEVNPESARVFGQDMLRAISTYFV